MRQLEKQFTKDWRTFTQLRKSDNAYLYEVRTDGGAVYYEVFKHTEHTSLNIVCYPGSTAFGSWAWNIPNIQKANEVFELLSAGRSGNDINRFMCGEVLI